MVFEALTWGLLGLIFGSFTNVLITREGKQSIRGRSMCPHCHHTLAWFELVPVLSFITLRGQCRSCKKPISWQYPIVEIMMGALFFAIGLATLPLILKAVSAAIAVILVAIAVYDLYTTLIPDRWVYVLGILALIYGALTNSIFSTYDALLFISYGFLVALPLALLWLVSHGRWMGLGDAKLVVTFPWILGLVGGYVALCLAFVIGALISVCILLPLNAIRTKIARYGITRFQGEREGYTMHSEVPFGPFLIAALCIVWFSQLFGFDLVGTLMPFFVYDF